MSAADPQMHGWSVALFWTRWSVIPNGHGSPELLWSPPPLGLGPLHLSSIPKGERLVSVSRLLLETDEVQFSCIGAQNSSITGGFVTQLLELVLLWLRKEHLDLNADDKH